MVSASSERATFREGTWDVALEAETSPRRGGLHGFLDAGEAGHGHLADLAGIWRKWGKKRKNGDFSMNIRDLGFVYAYGAINDPCVLVIFADRMQLALEIDACATDVTSLGWGGVGMLTFMLTCVTCTTDVTSLGWGGVGMLTLMWTCVTCTTDVTSLGRVSWKMSFAEWLVIRCDWICPTEEEKTIITLFKRVENRWTFHTKRTFCSWPQCNYDLTFFSRFYKTLQIPWFGERSIMKNPWVTPGR